MTLVNPIELLERKDKWYLGNGGMLIYAPPFPEYLDVPGFWDDCHFGDIAIPRLLCVSFALERDNTIVELKPILQDWRWFPDRIEAEYKLGINQGVGKAGFQGYSVTEKRMVSPDNTLVCEIEILQDKKGKSGSGKKGSVLHVVAWTVRQKGRTERQVKHSEFKLTGNSLKFSQQCAVKAQHRGEIPVNLDIIMASEPKPDSFEVTPGHGANMVPELSLTPFWDSLQKGRLSGIINGENILGSITWAGMHWAVNLTEKKPFNSRTELKVNLAGAGRKQLSDSSKSGYCSGSNDPQESWREFLTTIPHFQSSDKLLTHYYWYRWYGLRLNAVPKGGNYTAPAVTEGIAFFRGVITYSLMCHLYECKWLNDPALAYGCIRNHISHQTDKGHFPGHIFLSHINTSGFYHTDIGRSVRELIYHHPDMNFIREIYTSLKRLLRFYQNERDQEGSGLYDILDQFETGQEYTSRYFHADKRADLYGWEHKIKLKGVDVTSYVYNLAELIEEIAPLIGKKREADEYTNIKNRIRNSVRDKMWDDSRGFFFDYDLIADSRSRFFSAVGFYPLMSDLASDEMALSAAKYLEDTGKFSTLFPTPTIPVDDRFFSPAARWRGERANCPWNGRTWPMVNSHIIEVLARLAEIDPKKYRPMLVSHLMKFIDMMHYEKENRRGAGKDYNRPNCFEHYNPLDGTACEYRGIDDYMHSWVNDLILKYAAGVRITASKAVFDPYPFKLSNFLLTNLKIRSKKIDICYGIDREGKQSDGYKIYVDNVLEFKDKRIKRWEIEL
jgi:hypothetical protein